MEEMNNNNNINISLYSRSEGLRVGALLDISETARKAGIKEPIAISRNAWEYMIESSDSAYCDNHGKTWLMCFILHYMQKYQKNTDREKILPMERTIGGITTKEKSKVKVGINNDNEKVITIMLLDED